MSELTTVPSTTFQAACKIGIWFFWWFFSIPTSCTQRVVLCACTSFMFLTVFTRAHNWHLP